MAYEEGFPVISRLLVGITSDPGNFTYPTRNFALKVLPSILLGGRHFPWMPSLHVAMQMGPSHHPMSRTSGVWPLRILMSSCLGFLWFIV